MEIKSFPTHLGPLLVTDDFVPTQLQHALSEMIRQPIWKYGWRSNTRRDRYCYWHAHVAGGDGAARIDCEPELAAQPAYSSIYALFKILQAGPLRGHEPVRVYMNSHTFGVEGYVHQDNSDTENYFSTVYYAHPVWHQNWSGETVFYNRDESDILTSVFPRPGRAVTFHGAVPHCARAPSRDCNELRVSIVIKTQRQQRSTAGVSSLVGPINEG
ncbi:2OG-Fe(II) oxygenase [Herbaspirillum huttiense]|jgi:SM-20-related protein|uniref:2OG-Fe(II) oxygenase n=1 Tax=Herbaspirillum huttiense TaxID=863372 RepID=UPI002176B297|nr:2OG-Fe(II) oxygenase [Herbaspirillum huttiense]UWE16103.1 2OG-Fe(II) oxygenase [Herbaspirillum huttiense]